jgi:hypothetical protein
MARLQNWKDLFSYNKSLFENDYNEGQSLVIGVKSASEDKSAVSILSKSSKQYLLNRSRSHSFGLGTKHHIQNSITR